MSALKRALDCAAAYLAEAKRLAIAEDKAGLIHAHIAVAETRTAAARGEVDPRTPARFQVEPKSERAA